MQNPESIYGNTSSVGQVTGFELGRSQQATNILAPEYEQQEVKKLRLQPARKEESDINLSFCGCGFLGIYHVGVASCFHEYAPQISMHKIAGSSAGALVAVAHICGNLQLAYATTDILQVAIDARARSLGPFHPSFDINATVREALERGLPDDVHLRASGKLHISLTRFRDGANVVVSEFKSKEDVIQVLLCSCFIPFWSGFVPPKYQGVSYMDGGLSNNLLILDDKTVTVSPFVGEADICPQDDTHSLLQISLSNTSFSLTPSNLYRIWKALLPPRPEVLSDLCEQGFADGIRFLQRMNLISCTKCLDIRSSLLVSANGDNLEETLNDQVRSSNPFSVSTISDEQRLINLEQQEIAAIKVNAEGQQNTQRISFINNNNNNNNSNNNNNNNNNSININSLQDSEVVRVQSAASVTVNSTLASHVPLLRCMKAGRRRRTSSCSDSDCIISNLNIHEEIMKQVEAGETDWQLHESRSPDYTSTQAAAASSSSSEDENCDECVLVRKRALHRPLPKPVSDRISDVCEKFNKSLSNWLYSHRPIKYLSYLATPYYLPIDLSLAFIYRCWQRLPLIRSELINCICEIAHFLIEILKRLQSKSSSILLLESSLTRWEEDAIDYEKRLIRQRETSSLKLVASVGFSTSWSRSRAGDETAENR